MGGTGQNWSFFLHEDFCSGISTPQISTFEKCWLAGEATFKPKNVEIWKIGEKQIVVSDDDALEDEIARQRTATDKRENRILLELSGKEFRGDVYREEYTS